MYKEETDCSTVRRGHAWQCEEKKSPRGFYVPGTDFLSVRATVVHPVRPSARGRLERRGEGKRTNCHFLALSHPIPPAPSRSGPLSLSRSRLNPAGYPGPTDIWEYRLYRILILWLFLQFLNFKWKYWNTDMKRFIVTIYHYYHRPYCYCSCREFLVLAFGGGGGALVQPVLFLTVWWR